MRVEPTNRSGFTLALTAQELEPVFGEVRATGSWRDARYYHFPEPPPAIRAFRFDHTRAPTSTASDAAQTVQQPRAPAIPSRIPMPAIRTSREPLTEATFSDWARAWYAKLGAPAESAAYLGASPPGATRGDHTGSERCWSPKAMSASTPATNGSPFSPSAGSEMSSPADTCD
jgi:hypothetical protein